GNLAAALGIDAPSPVATVERAQRPEHETSREINDLLIDVFFEFRDRTEDGGHGELATVTPADLRADRFGLQRSHVRVDAMEAPRPHPNPGVHVPGRHLVRGMEVVVAPEVELDPDILIAECVKAELVYSEKLTRTTSVVVCNDTADLRGKAMHAVRKGIPLLTDTEFLDAVEQVQSRPRR
ncbi:MAG TPA: DNA polymerase III subunit epsilon, partial [Corynebacterium sp.]|nr:DNA polymerase III subunit epsilon [Corynebacterium sp.]